VTQQTPSEDLLWLAKKLSGILSLVPALEEFKSVEAATAGTLKKAEEAREEILRLKEEESKLFKSIDDLRGTLKEKTSECSQEYEKTKASLEAELEEVRRHHKTKLDASTAESVRNKLNVERQREEVQLRLKELLAEEKTILGRIYQSKQTLSDLQDQISALKARFT
jgi:hypothetical protein